MEKLFAFDGRLRRRDYWLMGLAVFALQLAALAVVYATVGRPMLHAILGGGAASEAAVNRAFLAIWLAHMAAGVAGAWPYLALNIKRLHDRDQPALLILAFLAPVVGPLFMLVNLGFIEGTPGPNKYGPSPKGLGGEGVATV